MGVAKSAGKLVVVGGRGGGVKNHRVPMVTQRGLVEADGSGGSVMESLCWWQKLWRAWSVVTPAPVAVEVGTVSSPVISDMEISAVYVGKMERLC